MLFTTRATALALSALLVSIAPPVATAGSGDDDSSRPENWLINFGDSYSKTAFDPEGEQPSAKNPIGNPELPGVTSSGGLNWLGYMVTDFNTSFSSDRNSLTLTYNFARPGGTVNRHPFGSKNPDFEIQTDWFEEHYVKNKETPRRWTPLNAVASIFYGVNDINGIFAKKLDLEKNNSGLITGLMKDYLAGLERLYGLGLRKYVMLAVPPLSILPLKLGWEVEKLNELSSCVWLWNRLLHEKVQIFKEAHDDVVVRVVDTEQILWEAFMDPSIYDAPDPTCTDKGGEKCLWWDISHPATKIMRKIASDVADVISTDEYRCYGGACEKDQTPPKMRTRGDTLFVDASIITIAALMIFLLINYQRGKRLWCADGLVGYQRLKDAYSG